MPFERVIRGMLYFPGAAAGRLQTAPDRLSAQDIALIKPDEIGRISELPAGFIISDAAPFSHTLIGLLGLGVPTVLIEADQTRLLREGMQVSIDGVTGRIDMNSEIPVRPVTPPPRPATGQAFTLADGTEVRLLASVRSAAAASAAVALGARGIGLVRSEFLTPRHDAVPDAAFYRTCFHELLDAASPLPVTIRLLDLAADKLPVWLPPARGLGQSLGLQGVRLYHTRPVEQVIRDQLAALGELADTRTFRLLIPFIVRPEEFVFWQRRVRACLPDRIAIGAMAETLAAVLDIPRLLDCADFVAIGCNDLMQAVFSADRDDPRLHHYLDPYAPVLFRLLRQVAQSSGERLDRIQLCGVLPQIQGVMPVLVGLGYRNFSVDAPFIPYLAEGIAGTGLNACKSLAADICAARTTQETLEILQLPPQRHPPFL